MNNKELVYKTLVSEKKPLKVSEIMKCSGLEKSVVEKAVKELKTEDKIYSSQRCFWQTK